jgi:hypothetical protein
MCAERTVSRPAIIAVRAKALTGKNRSGVNLSLAQNLPASAQYVVHQAKVNDLSGVNADPALAAPFLFATVEWQRKWP